MNCAVDLSKKVEHRTKNKEEKVDFSSSLCEQAWTCPPWTQLSVSSRAEHAHGNRVTCCTSQVYTTQTVQLWLSLLAAHTETRLLATCEASHQDYRAGPIWSRPLILPPVRELVKAGHFHPLNEHKCSSQL